MKIYMVGGAVRDRLMNIPVQDHDWVVVGSTPDQMVAEGYTQVGADFPVFLHPETKEEYALARTERKTGQGYKGFDSRFDPEVTLEEDLSRRDLTINAIAMDDQGNLIDPYNGQKDLDNKTLRHVTPAFEEDPLRVLRVARFMSRFKHLGFTIAPETLALMQTLSDSGELQTLTPERVWKELSRALMETSPSAFIETLREARALKELLPEIDALYGVPQPETYHPEIDTGVHTLMCVNQAARKDQNLAVRFSALVHDLGKALTPPDKWPAHHGHEELGVKPVKKLCERLRVPKQISKLAVNVTRFHLHVHRAMELKPSTLLKVLEQTDAIRNPDQFELFLQACEADATGRTGFEDKPYPQADYFRKALEIVLAVSTQPLVEAGIKGEAFGQKMKELRTKALSELKATYSESNN